MQQKFARDIRKSLPDISVTLSTAILIILKVGRLLDDSWTTTPLIFLKIITRDCDASTTGLAQVRFAELHELDASAAFASCGWTLVQLHEGWVGRRTKFNLERKHMGKHSIPAYECPKRGNTAPASACTVCSKRVATVDM